MLDKYVVYAREGYKHISRKHARQLEAICWIDNRWEVNTYLLKQLLIIC